MIATESKLPLEEFVVVHPMFDAPEQKRDGAELGLMKLTPAVRFWLILLRAYLVGVSALLAYHLLDLTGVLHR